MLPRPSGKCEYFVILCPALQSLVGSDLLVLASGMLVTLILPAGIGGVVDVAVAVGGGRHGGPL